MNNPSRRPWHVYALRDPRDLSVRYVGWTIDLRRRLRDHINESATGGRQAHTRKGYWIRALGKVGFEPIIHSLESGSGDTHWAECEQKWIAHFRSTGTRLTNLTDGGDGMMGWKMSPETIKRLSASMRGKKMSPKRLAQHIAMLRSRPPKSPETRARLSASLKGIQRTEEWREKLAAANRGKKYSAETIEKRASKLRGKPRTEAVKMRMRGHRLSLETRAKMSAWQVGRKLPESTCAKISASRTGRPAPPGLIARLAEINHTREHKPSELANLRHDKGCKLSAETRAKMSVAAKARCARQKQEGHNDATS